METVLHARRLALPPRLKGLDLRLRRGEVVALLGINGAGKSSALAALAGVLPGVRGRLEVLGRPLAADRRLRRHIGWLPQQPPLYPEMTVAENLAFFAGLQRPRPLPPAERDALLERFGLAALSRRLAHRLSGGERMRLGLACVLAHEPDILLLDEPSAGLDPLAAEQLRTLIRDAGSGRAVLIATHLLPDVELLCQRVLLMHRGELLADEPLARDRRCVVAAFARPPEEAALRALPGVAEAARRAGGEWLLTLTPEAPADLAEQVAARGWGLTAWHPQRDDLLARFRALSTGEAA